MDYHLLLSFVPLVLILLLGLSLFALLSSLLKDKSFFLLLSVFLAAPLFIGLFLYFLFFMFPDHAKLFYIIAISLPILLLAFFARKSLFLAFQILSDKWKIIKAEPLDLFSKIILSAVLFIVVLVFLRTIFWPINWVDQIYYLKQAYVFAQTCSLDLFLKWGFFHDSHIYNYQMNPAIRPGLPMIFTTTFLFNNSLQAAQFFCQTIMFYYFLITSSVVFYVSWKIAKQEKIKSALVALFLMLSTFHFIYLSTGGFKELLIIPAIILILFYISNQEKLLTKLNPWIYIGILTGLMSFVNYSGILISLFILLIFILTNRISTQKIINAAKILLLAVIFSGFEFFVFLNFIAPNHSTYSTAANVSSAAENEFASYGIASLKDLYIKGKFQGFFQIQYFGLIFTLFAILVIATYKNLIENRFIKNFLLFLLIYGLVIFDPLNINRHEFAYVLAISHKYTTLLVPLVAIVIAYQFNWLEKILKIISPTVITATLFSFFILDIIFFKNNPERLFNIISVFVPIFNNRDYYIQALKLLNDSFLIISAVLLISFAYFYTIKRKELALSFNKNSLTAIFFLFAFFLFPFLFFYNSNFGLKNTFIHSFDKNSIKLEKIIGWEDMYLPLKDLNNLPKDKKILFIDQPIGSIDIYLNLPMNNIYQIPDLPDDKNLTAAKQMGISYIYAKNNSRLGDESIAEINELKLMKQADKNLIFEVKP